MKVSTDTDDLERKVILEYFLATDWAAFNQKLVTGAETEPVIPPQKMFVIIEFLN